MRVPGAMSQPAWSLTSGTGSGPNATAVIAMRFQFLKGIGSGIPGRAGFDWCRASIDVSEAVGSPPAGEDAPSGGIARAVLGVVNRSGTLLNLAAGAAPAGDNGVVGSDGGVEASLFGTTRLEEAVRPLPSSDRTCRVTMQMAFDVRDAATLAVRRSATVMSIACGLSAAMCARQLDTRRPILDTRRPTQALVQCSRRDRLARSRRATFRQSARACPRLPG